MGVGGFVAEVTRHVASLVEAWESEVPGSRVVRATFLMPVALTHPGPESGWVAYLGVEWGEVCPYNDGVGNPEFHGLGCWSCFSWALSQGPC